jgi:hypothetical protein
VSFDDSLDRSSCCLRIDSVSVSVISVVSPRGYSYVQARARWTLSFNGLAWYIHRYGLLLRCNLPVFAASRMS